MSFGGVLSCVLIVAALGCHPAWPYSRRWGYYPSSGAALLLIVVVALILAGRA